MSNNENLAAYRVWDSKEDKYTDKIVLTPTGDLFEKTSSHGLDMYSIRPIPKKDEDRYKLERFTGMIDRNEKRVYGNDIVVDDDDIEYKVQQCIQLCEWQCKPLKGGAVIRLTAPYMSEYLAVVGNAHQHGKQRHPYRIWSTKVERYLDLDKEKAERDNTWCIEAATGDPIIVCMSPEEPAYRTAYKLFNYVDRKEIIIERWTGLYDKYNNPIYENDVIYHRNSAYLVKWRQCDAAFGAQTKDGWCLQALKDCYTCGSLRIGYTCDSLVTHADYKSLLSLL